MKRYLLLGLAIVLLVSLGGVVSCGPATVTFPAPDLEAAIREAIDKPEGPILALDVEALTSLFLEGRDITDLTGLDKCSNLTNLVLIGNQINDISQLASLSSLTNLNISANQIKDITPLASLTNLTHLGWTVTS